MTEGLDVPVALFAFNRPDCLARVLSSVRTARPRLLFVVADGARPTHPEDMSRCKASLALIESIDWPCEIRRRVAEQNLGCDVRLSTGLDWVFGQAAEAIVLEDDIVPDPSFFPWCAAMLHRYRDEPTIMHISGRNELGCWECGNSDHLVARRGSISGWATWARAWFGVDRSFSQNATTQSALEQLTPDPLLAAELAMLLDLLSSGRLTAWDSTWSLGKGLAGGLSVIPPINLVANIGFGWQATHSVDEADVRATLPVGSVARPAAFGTKRVREVDARYDRWSLLLALMTTYRNPALARKLASFPGAVSERSRALAYHLAPFAVPEESIAVLEHLKSVGMSTPRIAALHAELELALSRGEKRGHV
jgi:hypothetical protein